MLQHLLHISNISHEIFSKNAVGHASQENISLCILVKDDEKHTKLESMDVKS